MTDKKTVKKAVKKPVNKKAELLKELEGLKTLNTVRAKELVVELLK